MRVVDRERGRDGSSGASGWTESVVRALRPPVRAPGAGASACSAGARTRACASARRCARTTPSLEPARGTRRSTLGGVDASDDDDDAEVARRGSNRSSSSTPDRPTTTPRAPPAGTAIARLRARVPRLRPRRARAPPPGRRARSLPLPPVTLLRDAKCLRVLVAQVRLRVAVGGGDGRRRVPDVRPVSPLPRARTLRPTFDRPGPGAAQDVRAVRARARRAAIRRRRAATPRRRRRLGAAPAPASGPAALERFERFERDASTERRPNFGRPSDASAARGGGGDARGRGGGGGGRRRRRTRVVSARSSRRKNQRRGATCGFGNVFGFSSGGRIRRRRGGVARRECVRASVRSVRGEGSPRRRAAPRARVAARARRSGTPPPGPSATTTTRRASAASAAAPLRRPRGGGSRGGPSSGFGGVSFSSANDDAGPAVGDRPEGATTRTRASAFGWSSDSALAMAFIPADPAATDGSGEWVPGFDAVAAASSRADRAVRAPRDLVGARFGYCALASEGRASSGDEHDDDDLHVERPSNDDARCVILACDAVDAPEEALSRRDPRRAAERAFFGGPSAELRTNFERAAAGPPLRSRRGSRRVRRSAEAFFASTRRTTTRRTSPRR